MTTSCRLSTSRDSLFITSNVANVPLEATFKAIYEFIESLFGLLVGNLPCERECTEEFPRNHLQPIRICLNCLQVSCIWPVLALIPTPQFFVRNHPFHHNPPQGIQKSTEPAVRENQRTEVRDEQRTLRFAKPSVLRTQEQHETRNPKLKTETDHKKHTIILSASPPERAFASRIRHVAAPVLHRKQKPCHLRRNQLCLKLCPVAVCLRLCYR